VFSVFFSPSTAIPGSKWKGPPTARDPAGRRCDAADRQTDPFYRDSSDTSPSSCLFPPCFSCRLQTLSRGQGQRCDPAQYGSEELPCEMALRQQQPVIPGVPYQPSARLHQPLLQACQRPVPDFLWQYQPPPKVPQVIGDHSVTVALRWTRTDGNRGASTSLTTSAIVHGALGGDPLGPATCVAKGVFARITVAKYLSHQ